jgi:DegV family protein with EDD domain
VNLTAENTAVVLDSTADFPAAPERFPNFRVVPLYVRFGDESFRDYVEMTPDAFYARLPTAAQLPTTSQPTPADFLAAYEELSGYERILSLQISSTLSGTYASAQTAAETLGDGRVRVIDTRTVSASLALLALAVQRRLERGTTDDEIDELVWWFTAEHRLLFTIDTLEYLRRGGRIGRAAALAGTLLSVKPILTIRDDEVVPRKRVRGVQKALDEFRAELMARSRDEPTLRVGLAHAAAPERLAKLEAIVRAARPRATIEVATSLGPVLGTHAGPGTVGLFWFDDPVL